MHIMVVKILWVQFAYEHMHKHSCVLLKRMTMERSYESPIQALAKPRPTSQRLLPGHTPHMHYAVRFSQ